MLSSWVASGHVGLSAAAPAVQILGGEVTQLPTTILSNHAGWPHRHGGPLAVGQIWAMVDALEANGWLAGHDALVTGYLPSPEHVDLAARLIDRMRRASERLRVVVDPVLGDDPKGLYVAPEIAAAVRDRLVPLADVLTPNRFELSWLSGRPVDDLSAAQAAARRLLAGKVQEVLVTSVPVSATETGVMAVSHDSARLWASPLRTGVPNGVGDVFSGLVAAGLTTGAALGHLAALIDASLGKDHLKIAQSAPHWTGAGPVEPVTLPGTGD